MSDNRDLLNDKDVCSFEEHEAENVCSNKDAVACGDSLPSVEKNPINQRFLRFRKKNGCVFLFPQSDDITGGLPQGIALENGKYTFWRKDTFSQK